MHCPTYSSNEGRKDLTHKSRNENNEGHVTECKQEIKRLPPGEFLWLRGAESGEKNGAWSCKIMLIYPLL